jgi:transposase
MGNVRFVGLDVHKESIAIAVADSDASAPSVVSEIPNDTSRLLKELRKLGKAAELRCCYEAGPTGFGLYRALMAAKIQCVVIAPSLVPKQAGVRVKTDSRDALKLARFLRSGDLTTIHVPDAATEAMRDLERSRETRRMPSGSHATHSRSFFCGRTVASRARRGRTSIWRGFARWRSTTRRTLACSSTTCMLSRRRARASRVWTRTSPNWSRAGRSNRWCRHFKRCAAFDSCPPTWSQRSSATWRGLRN